MTSTLQAIRLYRITHNITHTITQIDRPVTIFITLFYVIICHWQTKGVKNTQKTLKKSLLRCYIAVKDFNLLL